MDLGKVNVPTVVAAVATVFILMCVSSCISMLHRPSPCQMRALRQQMYRQNLMDNNNDDSLIESFGNEEAIAKKRDIDEKLINYSKFNPKLKTAYYYKTIELTAPSTVDNYPSNMLFGRADKYLISNDKMYLDVYCNLYVLGGDPFDRTDLSTIKHKYSVVLTDNTNTNLTIGELKKDGDGIYKIKIDNVEIGKSIDELMRYNKINIVYSINSKEQVLLTGDF